MDLPIETVRLSGGPLSYRVVGEGRPVVAFHASGGPRAGALAEAVAAGHRLYMPVTPGFDGTPFHSHTGGMRPLAATMAEFLRTVVGARCDAMGQSFGGWLALWLAVDHPDLLDQMVLLCPAGLREGGKGGLPQDAAEVRRRLYAYPDRAPAEWRSADEMAANRRASAAHTGDVAFDADLAAALPSVKARTLVVMGTRDEVIPVETGLLLKRHIPLSHLTYVYDAAHAIDIDQPQRTTRIVRAFLDKGPAFIVKDAAA
jgi:pimeloyl-ACP methyl ester carboxylesterase